MTVIRTTEPFPQGSDWIPPTEYCPVSTGIGILGDRWSLLIVRELLTGNNRFNEIGRALPGLSRGLLSARLRYLQQVGVATRDPSSLNYSLTDQGRALRPVLEALGTWAIKWRLPSEGSSSAAVGLVLWRSYQSIDRALLPNGSINIHFQFPDSEEKEGWLYVNRTGGSTCTGFSNRSSDLTVTADTTTFGDLWSGRVACKKAISSGDIVFEGPKHLIQGFPNWFPHRPAARSVT